MYEMKKNFAQITLMFSVLFDMMDMRQSVVEVFVKPSSGRRKNQFTISKKA
jgi:hypothetical protein